jgi:hypothetical protein
MDITVRLRGTATDKDTMPRMDSERWLPVGLAREAADEIERLRALLAEVRSDINDYGFSECFADEAHITIAKINVVIGGDA